MADSSHLDDELTVVKKSMDNEIKINNNLLIEQKSVQSNNDECESVKKHIDETQKMEKMSNSKQCNYSNNNNSNCSSSDVENMIEKCAIPVNPPILSGSVNKCAISENNMKKNIIGQNGLRANATITSAAATTLIELKPPTKNAKDIEDIRKKRRCADRYDSSESSDR